jgi:hypothetical protein
MQHRFSDPNHLPLPLSFHDAQSCLLGPCISSLGPNCWISVLPRFPFFFPPLVSCEGSWRKAPSICRRPSVICVFLCENKLPFTPILSRPNNCSPDFCAHHPVSTFTYPRRCRSRTVGLSKNGPYTVQLPSSRGRPPPRTYRHGRVFRGSSSSPS